MCVFFVPFFQCFGSGSLCPESGSYFFPEPVSWSGQNPDPWKKRTKILNTRQIFSPKGIIVWICFYILCYTNFPKNCRMLIWKIKRITDPVTQLCGYTLFLFLSFLQTSKIYILFMYELTYMLILPGSSANCGNSRHRWFHNYTFYLWTYMLILPGSSANCWNSRHCWSRDSSNQLQVRKSYILAVLNWLTDLSRLKIKKNA